ncbi:MAG: DMT family transporter [Bacteroidota bacterium]|nr:DMT family transporter [Bacteroidota bacterium]MDP3144089.1 DMT family transporter [Bacteroidota bacterium]
MIYIILTIVVSVLLLLVFKAFQKQEVNSIVAIVINYVVAGITGVIFLGSNINVDFLFNSNWILISIPLGFLFISIFYLISQTAQKISISTASVANKMSVIMPVLFSVIFLGQQLSILKIIGVVLAMFAVYLSTRSYNKEKGEQNLFWLPILVFIGSGLIDITINACNALYIKSTDESAVFSICTFLSAFIIGTFVLMYLIIFKKSILIKDVFNSKNILGGVLLGVPNYFSIYFIFKSLETNVLQSAQLFPVLNLANVALSAFLGWLVYKEKLAPVNLMGIVLAIISIVLISF